MLGLTGFRLTWTHKYTVYPQKEVEVCDYILIDNALMKRKVVDATGVPDKDYFMMCEDYDYCIRVKKAGFKIGIIKNNHVNRLHLGSGKHSKNTLWRGYYHARNHMLILRKYFTIKTFIHYVVIQLKYLIGSLSAKDRWLRIKLRLKGVIDGMRSVKGKTLQPDSLRFTK
jgi:GT2 family glycosyltransferase